MTTPHEAKAREIVNNWFNEGGGFDRMGGLVVSKEMIDEAVRASEPLHSHETSEGTSGTRKVAFASAAPLYTTIWRHSIE